MKRFLRYPSVNIICISLFSAFYAVSMLYAVPFFEGGAEGGMSWLQEFIDSGGVAVLSLMLIGLTAVVAILLLLRRRLFDEYHVSILSVCLVTALVLTIVAIGIFFMNILLDPSQVRLKFTLFALIHWTTVVLADLVFVLICGRR